MPMEVSLDYIYNAETLAFRMLERKLTPQEAAEDFGLSLAEVESMLQLLDLSTKVRNALIYHRLSERHARALLPLPSEMRCLAVIEHIVQHDLDGEQTEAYVDSLLHPAPQNDRHCKQIYDFLDQVQEAAFHLYAQGVNNTVTKERQNNLLTVTVRIHLSTQQSPITQTPPNADL